MAVSFLQSLTGQNVFPEVNYNFIVFVGMDIFGAFQGVEGMSLRVDPFEYKEGGRNYAPRRLPFDGPMKPGEITLRWGTPIWATLYEWMNDVEVGAAFRRTVVICQLGRHGWPTRLITLTGAWPTEWKGSNLNASGSEWALEELTLVYNRIFIGITPVAQVMNMAGGPATTNGSPIVGG